MRRSDIAFAAQTRRIDTARHWNQHEETSMNATKVITLLAAVLLTATQFLALDYDVHQRVRGYQAELASEFAAHG
jgi:hypothetical protein